MKVSGYVLIALGLLAMIIGYGMSGAGDNSFTLNIGLLNDKSNLIVSGGFFFLSGIVLLSSAIIVDALKSHRGNDANSAAVSSAVDGGSF